MAQQPLFLFDAAGIAGDFSSCAHHPVTGNQDADGIPAHSLSHRLGRHFGFSRQTDHFPGQVSVGSDFSIGNVQKKLPDLLLKGCSLRMQRKVQNRILAPEVSIQPLSRLYQYGMAILFLCFPLHIQSGEGLVCTGQQQRPQRRIIGSIIHMGASFQNSRSGNGCGCIFFTDLRCRKNWPAHKQAAFWAAYPDPFPG